MVELFTDASNTVWGFHTSDQQLGKGLWKPPMSTFHINVKEFAGLWIALWKYHWRRGTSVRLLADNTSVVNCLNRRGSIRSIPVWSWTLSIARFLDSRNWTLSRAYKRRAEYLGRLTVQKSTSLNKMDGRYSVIPLDSFSGFSSLGISHGDLAQSLFLTCMCPHFSTQAVAVDALSLDWNRWKSVYLSPPIKAVPLVLAHFKGRVMLISPWWPAQS